MNAIVKTNGNGAQSSWELAQRKAKAFSQSDLVPAQYRDSIANILLAMDTAERIGASVLAVMQNLYIIHGKPAFESKFLIATINRCGRYSPLRYRWQGEEGELSWGCRAVAKSKEDGEECLGPLVTLQTAKDMRWDEKRDKKGSIIRDNKWKQMPELMLMYRAAAWWQRTYAPELSLGMRTVEEELDIYANAPEETRTNSLDKFTTELTKEVEVEVIEDKPEAPVVVEQEPPEPLALPWEDESQFVQEVKKVFNPREEALALAKTLYGEQRYKDELKKLCKANGYPKKLTEEHYSEVLDTLIVIRDER